MSERVHYPGITSCGCPYIKQRDPSKHWKECHYRLNCERDTPEQKPSQGGEAVAVYQFAGDSPYKSWTDIPKKLFDEYAARGEWLTRTLYTHPSGHGAVRQSLSAENQRIVPVEPLLAPPHPMDAVPVRLRELLQRIADNKDASHVIGDLQAELRQLLADSEWVK